MDKAKGKPRTPGQDSASLAKQAEAAFGKGGDGLAWLRDDGAVCFGDECVVINRDKTTGALELQVKPDKCGAATGEVILDHLIRTAGKGVNIKIPPMEDKPK